MVAFSGYSPGTIVVHTGQRALYLVIDSAHALRYSVGVGRAGKQWAGTSYISGKYIKPAWTPPADVRKVFYVDLPAPRDYERARMLAWNRVKAGE